jgi:hypothetical protein
VPGVILDPPPHDASSGTVTAIKSRTRAGNRTSENPPACCLRPKAHDAGDAAEPQRAIRRRGDARCGGRKIRPWHGRHRHAAGGRDFADCIDRFAPSGPVVIAKTSEFADSEKYRTLPEVVILPIPPRTP